MLRLVLLTLCAALLYITGAQAHSYHESCEVGYSRLGTGPHFHPRGDLPAQHCGGGGGGYYGGGGGGGGYYRAPRPGDYGPQTNRGQDCYNVYGRRICCPKGWTVQDGRCAPYRGY